MSPVRRSALVASLLIAMSVMPLMAQDRARGSGTLTLTPDDRVSILTTRRARLGITINLLASATDSIGALIVGVTPNGPAAKAGLRSGDIVVRLNGKLTTEGDRADPDESAPGLRLIKLVSEINPGDTTVVQYRRAAEQRQATVIAGDEPGATWTYSMTLPGTGVMRQGPTPLPTTRQPVQGFQYELRTDSMFFKADSLLLSGAPMISRMRRPMPMAFMMGSPLANLELAPVNPKLGKYFGTPQGVLVIDLPDSSELGLLPGDVVLAVDGRQVQSPGILLRVLMSYEPGETFSLQVMRDKKRQTVSGNLGER